MTEENIQGVDVNVTGNKQWPENYEQSDVEQIYKDAGVADGKVDSWKGLIQYVEKHGEGQWHITPGEAIAMKEDLEHVVKSGVAFTKNPDQAFKEMHKYRGQDRSQEPKIAKQHHQHS